MFLENEMVQSSGRMLSVIEAVRFVYSKNHISPFGRQSMHLLLISIFNTI